MKRNLSKISMITNFTLLTANSVLLFIVAMLLLTLTGNGALLLLPGMVCLAIVSAIWGIFDTGYVTLAGWLQTITNPSGQPMFTQEEIAQAIDPTSLFQRIGSIVGGVFEKPYTGLNHAIPVGLLTATICLIVGIVALVRYRKMYAVVSNPMDWYSCKLSGVYVNFVLVAVYSASMLAGTLGVAFGPNAMDGAAQKLSIYFAITAVVVLLGAVIMLVQRVSSVSKYKKMSEEEQQALCDKQAKYMKKSVRKRQLRKLKGKGRTASK